MAQVTTAPYVPNPQELPAWLSYSTYVTIIDDVVVTTEAVIQLPQTYFGPSIPLGEGWVFGGSVAPTTTALETPSEISTESSLQSSIASASASSIFTASSSSAPQTSSPSTLASTSNSQTPIPIPTSSITSTSSTPSLSTTQSDNPDPTTLPIPIDDDQPSNKVLLLSTILPAIAVLLMALLFMCWYRKQEQKHRYGAVATTRRKEPLEHVDGLPESKEPEKVKHRAWFPGPWATHGLRQRSTSAHSPAGNRVPSNNIWADEAEDEGFVLISKGGPPPNGAHRKLKPDSIAALKQPARSSSSGHSRNLRESNTDSSAPTIYSQQHGFFGTGVGNGGGGGGGAQHKRTGSYPQNLGHKKSGSFPSLPAQGSDLFYSLPSSEERSNERQGASNVIGTIRRGDESPEILFVGVPGEANQATSGIKEKGRLVFPIPPDRNQKGLGVGESDKSHRNSADSSMTTGTVYYSIHDKESSLKRRSHQSGLSRDIASTTYPVAEGVDEYGRRVVSSSNTLPSTPLPDASPDPRLPGNEHEESPLIHHRKRPTARGETRADRVSSFIAGSISSLFGAKRASANLSYTEDQSRDAERHGEHDVAIQSSVDAGQGYGRNSYAGQPLVGDEVYRRALLNGSLSSSRESEDSARHEERDITEEPALENRSLLPIPAVQIETPGGTLLQNIRKAKSHHDMNSSPSIFRPKLTRGYSGQGTSRVASAVHSSIKLDDQLFKRPDPLKKTSIYVPGSPYSPARASSQEASVQEGSLSQSSGATQSSKSKGSEAGSAQELGEMSYSVAAIRGKRSVPQLLTTEDALAGRTPSIRRPMTRQSWATTPTASATELLNADRPRPHSSIPDASAESDFVEKNEKERQKWWLGRFGKGK